jgi:hypothetical protein
VPALPNYIVGRVLADDTPEFAAGRATVAARVRAGAGVTPLGLEAPPNFSVLYGQSASTLFGRSLALRCPHYLADVGGRCGVWAHRAAVCATWFCKYERGATGQSFWRALQQLLSQVERSLACWCVLELGPSGAALRQLISQSQSAGRDINAHTLDGGADAAQQRALWGEWLGREAEFYRACADRVNALAWADVLRLGGVQLQVYAKLAAEAYAQLCSEQLPAALKVGPFNILRLGADAATVNSYNGYDPVELPTKLLAVLPYFDGRPLAQTLASIAAEKGVKLDRELVRRLVDFKILVPSDGAESAQPKETRA